MSNNIRENHIRHVKEGLEDILSGLRNYDLASIRVGIDPLVVDNMYIVNNNNHIFECYPPTKLIKHFDNEDYMNAYICAQTVQNMFDHEVYEKNGDVWDDAVDKLLEALYKLLELKWQKKKFELR